jgi:hypothetical protein
MSWNWFNISAPYWVFHVGNRRVSMRLWNLFNRVTSDGQHWWGFGVLQIGKRHLFYIGYNSVSMLFVGQSA